MSVDIYKERWAPALRRVWDGQGQQPEYHFNAPADCGDDQLRELTRETKREKLEPVTKRRIGWEWFRQRGSKNELWDLLIYNNAALEILAYDIFRNQLGEDAVSWPQFWDMCRDDKLFTH